MKQPIRVLCVFSELDRGGAESMCMNLYRRMEKSQIQFDFVKHTTKKCLFEDEILSLGGHIFEAPRYKAINHFDYCGWWKQHFRDHPEHQIIHGHYYTTSAIYFKIAHRYGRKTIGHSHSTSIGMKNNKKGVKYALTEYWLSKVGQYSDYRLACSVPAGKWLYGDKPFTVLNNAIDSRQFTYNPTVREEMRSQLALAEDDFVIGTVGSMGYPKNPVGIVRITAEAKKRNQHVKLLWAGDGSMRHEVENAIRQYGLEDCCNLLGIRNDVHRVLQAMDVFVLPSIYEGLPVVAVEAQAAGLPCILSDAVSKEICITDLCTFLPIADPARWAEKILNLNLTRTDTQQEIENAGYDIEATTAWLSDFYISIAAKLDDLPQMFSAS